MHPLRRSRTSTALAAALTTGAVAALTMTWPAAGRQQGPAPRGMLLAAATAATGPSELRRLDGLVDALANTNELVLASRYADRQLPERTHESFVQYHEGVPVHGGSVSRQLANGVTVSILGTIHEGLGVDTTPHLSPDAAIVLIERLTGAAPVTDAPPTLVILPVPFGEHAYVLAWRATMRDLRRYFLDAHRGVIVYEEGLLREQAAVGAGHGILDDRKKVSVSRAGGGFQAYDRLRPAEIITLDLRHDKTRRDELLYRQYGSGWRPSDVAHDTDNDWRDPAVVDAHAHLGFTYDHLAARHGWGGIDGRDGRILGMVNIGRDYANAFFAPPPFGPEGAGVVGFGQWEHGTPIVSADIIGHEAMHGVTHFSVSQRTGEKYGLLDTLWGVLGPSDFTVDGRTFHCGDRWTFTRGRFAERIFQLVCEEGRFLLLANEGGAVNEAFSDIIGTAVEFSLHEPGIGPLRADYLVGEDTGRTARSLARPQSLTLGHSALRYPDAYSGLVRFAVGVFEDDRPPYFFFSDIGSVDGGHTMVSLPSFDYSGVHWNSTILSHAFHLAIEGGRNATTGRTVAGVGGGNRADVERAFFRALTDLLPASTNLTLTATVIRQSAIDLFGHASPTHTAIDQALHAVGL